MKYVSGMFGCILGMLVGLHLIIYASTQMLPTDHANFGLQVLIFASLLGGLVGVVMICFSELKGYSLKRSMEIGISIMVANIGGIITILFVIDLLRNLIWNTGEETNPSWVVLVSSYLIGVFLGTLGGVGFYLGIQALDKVKRIAKSS